MSETQAPSSQVVKPPFDKKALLGDLFIFASILAGFFFVSLSWKAFPLDNVLGMQVDHHGELIKIMLLYILLIITFKIVSLILPKQSQTEGQESWGAMIKDAIGNSLFSVIIIASLTAYAFAQNIQKKNATIGLKQVVHIAIWVLVAQVSKLIGAAFGRLSGFHCVSAFGWTISLTAGALVVGSIAGLNAFKLL